MKTGTKRSNSTHQEKATNGKAEKGIKIYSMINPEDELLWKHKRESQKTEPEDESWEHKPKDEWTNTLCDDKHVPKDILDRIREIDKYTRQASLDAHFNIKSLKMEMEGYKGQQDELFLRLEQAAAKRSAGVIIIFIILLLTLWPMRLHCKPPPKNNF